MDKGITGFREVKEGKTEKRSLGITLRKLSGRTFHKATDTEGR